MEDSTKVGLLTAAVLAIGVAIANAELVFSEKAAEARSEYAGNVFVVLFILFTTVAIIAGIMCLSQKMAEADDAPEEYYNDDEFDITKEK